MTGPIPYLPVKVRRPVSEATREKHRASQRAYRARMALLPREKQKVKLRPVVPVPMPTDPYADWYMVYREDQRRGHDQDLESLREPELVAYLRSPSVLAYNYNFMRIRRYGWPHGSRFYPPKRIRNGSIQ